MPVTHGLNYIINIMLICAIIGMCVKIFFGNMTSKDGTYGRANSTIWGYGIVSLSILTLVFVSYAIHDKINTLETSQGTTTTFGGILKFIKSFLASSGPAAISIVILFWIIDLNVTYYQRINKGQVATEYYQLSAGTSFLFVFQIILLFQYLKMFINNKTGNGDANSAMTQARLSFATYFVTMLNVIVVAMMTIILKFFSTDG